MKDKYDRRAKWGEDAMCSSGILIPGEAEVCKGSRQLVTSTNLRERLGNEDFSTQRSSSTCMLDKHGGLIGMKAKHGGAGLGSRQGSTSRKEALVSLCSV